MSEEVETKPKFTIPIWIGQVAGAFVGQVLLQVAPILSNIVAEGFKRAISDTSEIGKPNDVLQNMELDVAPTRRDLNATLRSVFACGPARMRRRMRDAARLHSAWDQNGTENTD